MSHLRTISLFQALFFTYVVIGLLVMTFVIPPFQKSDEWAHYYRAVSVTNAQLFCTQDEDGEYSVSMKRRYADLPDILHIWDVALRGDQRFNRDWLKADFSRPELNEETRLSNVCSLPFIGYLPNATGILLGKVSENPLYGFYASRVIGSLFFVACLVYALAITPNRYRLLIYFFGGLPIVLHQVSTVGYDAVQLSLYPVLFGAVMRFSENRTRFEPLHVFIFLASLFVAVNIRSLSYVPLLLLYFAVPSTALAATRQGYLKLTAAFAAIGGSITLILSAIYLARIDSGPEPPEGVDSAEQLPFVLRNPWSLVEASYRTLQNQGEWLLKQTIGIYGWIDTPMGYFPYYLVFFVLGLVVYHVFREDEPILNWKQIGVLTALVTGTCALLFLSLYLVWSPVGHDEVMGLQGRYFIGLLPFAIVVASQAALLIGRQRFINGMLLILLCILLYNMYRAVDLRYYG